MAMTLLDPPSSAKNPRPSAVRPRAQFPTTHKSVVARASNAAEPAAFAELCETYWYPVYCFLRSRGCRPDHIDDVTQGFFASLLAEGSEPTKLAKYDPARWRFRTWLRTRANWYFHNYLDQLKSGRYLLAPGGAGDSLIHIDAAEAEARFQLDWQADQSAERLFDRCWAQVVVSRARARLEERYANHPKLPRLKELLAGLSDELDEPARKATDAERTRKFNLKASIKVPFRRCLREEIARTLPKSAFIDDELELLFDALDD